MRSAAPHQTSNKPSGIIKLFNFIKPIMGESKRKKQQQAVLLPDLQAAVSRVASAIRRLALAASGYLGSDCYLHAEMGRLLLADLGFKATLVSGYAAWRVGPGDGDVISHTLHTQGFLPPGAQGFVYHIWLDCAGFLVDFSTYQLTQKGVSLDIADGGHTEVQWCPPYLLLSRDQVRSYREVAMALNPGVAYYETDDSLVERLGPPFKIDPADLNAARLLMANPEMQALGPNDIGDAVRR